MLLRNFLSLDQLDDRYYSHPVYVDHTGGAVAATEESALKVATIYRAVNVASAGVALLPRDVYDPDPSGGKRIVKGDPLRQLMRRAPNRNQTAFRFFHHMVGHVLLGGNYYAHKLGRPGLPPAQLWPLDPCRMRVADVLPSGELVYEYSLRSGGTKPLTQDEVLHVRGFSRDGITGISVFDLMREKVSLALAAQRQRSSFVQNELRPSVLVTVQGELDEDGERNIQKSFMRTYGGPSKAGVPLVLGDGATVAPFTISPQDAQWIEGEHFLVEEFLRYIGIPGVMVGYNDKTATFASAESFFQSYVTHCLWPLAGNIEDELSLSLWGADSERFLEFNLSAMMRADSAARGTYYRTMVEMGIFTRNEVRALENRNPLPGLDDPLTPKNMGTGGPDGSSKPVDGQGQQALLHRFVRTAAARVVRKEVLHLVGADGQKGLAGKYAKNAAGWRGAVADFYARHVEMVENELHLSADAAGTYCREQREAVLVGGVAVVETWEDERVAHLVRLAGGASC